MHVVANSASGSQLPFSVVREQFLRQTMRCFEADRRNTMNRKRSLRSSLQPATLMGAVAFMLFTISCLAQQSPRALRNHVPSAVSNGEARLTGSLPATQKLHVTISLPLRNQAALDGLLKRLYDPSNPDYRHFLSGAEFTEQFAPTPEDYQGRRLCDCTRPRSHLSAKRSPHRTARRDGSADRRCIQCADERLSTSHRKPNLLST